MKKMILDLKKVFNLIKPSLERYIKTYLKPVNLILIPIYRYREIDGETAYQINFELCEERDKLKIIYIKITIDPNIDPISQLWCIYNSIYKIFIGIFAITKHEKEYINKQSQEFATKYLKKTMILIEKKLRGKKRFQEEFYNDLENELLNLIRGDVMGLDEYRKKVEESKKLLRSLEGEYIEKVEIDENIGFDEIIIQTKNRKIKLLVESIPEVIEVEKRQDKED